MNSRFSDMAVKLLVSSSIFNPALLASEGFFQYGKEEIKAFAQFYGSEATVSYDGETYTSHPLHDQNDLVKRVAGIQKSIEARNSISNGKKENYRSATYVTSQGAHGVYWSLHGIFPEILKLLNIILFLPVETSSFERSFSSMNW